MKAVCLQPLSRWKVIIAGLLASQLISVTAMASNWAFNGQPSEGGHLYVDMDSLDYSTPTVKYLFKHEPGTSKKTPNGLNYAYTVSQYAADCTNGTSTEVSKNYLQEKGWLVATGTPNKQPIILSQSPNGVHTVLVNALCYLNQSGLHRVALNLSMDWTEEVAFNPGNDPRSMITNYTISPQSMQKKGDLLFFVQNMTFAQLQTFGDKYYKNRVSLGAFNCRTEQRSPFLLSLYYGDADPQPVGWNGVTNPEAYTPFARFENTEKFRRYCAKFSEVRNNAPVNVPPAAPSRSHSVNKPIPIPVAPMPVEEEKKKTPPVRSDSLL